MAQPLHFLLTPAGPMELVQDKHMFFGRSDGNNIVVDDMRASRRHAELYYDGSAFVLIDLNSSNGTRVNDSEITTVVLKDNDVIQIGVVSYRYRVVSDAAELETTLQKIQQDSRSMVTAEMPALADAIPDNDFNGVLATMGVTEICQTLELGRRSGLLRIQNEKREKGLLYFRNGEIIGAENGLLKGDEAAMRILSTKEGHFSFLSQGPALEQNVSQSTPHLLLEAARQGDESGR